MSRDEPPVGVNIRNANTDKKKCYASYHTSPSSMGALELFRERLYKGLVKKAIERSGFRPLLHDIYWSLYWRKQRTVTHSICGVSAEFDVRSRGDAVFLEHILNSEETVLADILDRTTESDVFFDIGSHHGLYSCLVGKRARQVVAFEPREGRFSRLERNLEKNSIPGKCVQAAVGEEDGHRNWEVADGEYDVCSIDTLISSGRTPAPTVIKIDVEGAELNVLRGMRRTLESDPPGAVYIELHPESAVDAGLSEADQTVLRRYLSQRGYRVSNMYQRNNQPFLRAEFDV